MKNILIIGSIAVDYLELPDGTKGECIGGSATYFTLASGRFGPVNVVGIVGTDFPEEGHKLFKKHAANLDDLKIEEGKTFRWGGRYHNDWEHRTTLYTELGVFESFRPELSPENKQCGLVCLGNIHPALQLGVIDQIENSESLIICDTMNLWIETTHDLLVKVIEKVDILLVNETESFLLTGEKDIESAASAILKMGPDVVVIKLGSKGAVLTGQKEKINVDVYPIERVVDPTGAGDVFFGGFAGELSNGGTMVSALLAGSAIASFCVEGFGTSGMLTISREDISERIEVIKGKSPLLEEGAGSS